MSVLDDELVRRQLAQAWQESEPGTNSAHEEGGFILRNADGSHGVARWPHGERNEITVPPHPGGKWTDLRIIATFHTHPNPGPDFQQEPSLTDIRAVRNDPDLAHPEYEGEYVIAAEEIYCVRRNGDVTLVGKTNAILSLGAPGN